MASDEIVCDCTACACGAAKRYRLTVTGITDGTCDECDSLNKVYILDLDTTGGMACKWLHQETEYPCNSQADLWELGFIRNSDTCQLDIEVTYYLNPSKWKKLDIRDCREEKYVLSGGNNEWPTSGGLTCNFPSSVTVESILPANVDDIVDKECFFRFAQPRQAPTWAVINWECDLRPYCCPGCGNSVPAGQQ